MDITKTIAASSICSIQTLQLGTDRRKEPKYILRDTGRGSSALNSWCSFLGFASGSIPTFASPLQHPYLQMLESKEPLARY